MAYVLHLHQGMRISALSSTLLLGTLATLATTAHAEHKAPQVAANQVAAINPPREERPRPSLTTGDLALTGKAGAAPQEALLSAGEITALVAPHAPEIERCYLDGIGASQRPGHLDLTFMIGRDGNVFSLKAAAAGVPAKVVAKIETCVRNAVDGIQFPARRSDTTAIVPYFFQKTNAPNAGPVMSCWNPRGC